MLPETTPKLTAAELLQLIEEAKNAELCRDAEAFRSILQTVWQDINIEPDFQNYGEVLNAELLRLCGVFLTLYGKYSLNLKNYQSRAKDLLTKSIRIFEANNLPDKAAEANVNLAFCYWNEGEINECETILDIVEADFGNNQFHPVYIQICLNRLLVCFWKNDIKTGLQIIEEIKTSIQFCNDFRLQGMFHIQTGIFYTNTKMFEAGIFHLNEAFRLAKKTNNRLYIALALNNLAFLYKETKDFKKGFDYISKAIDEVNKVKNQGFLPHALDTKALILLDWNKPKNALETINESIESFKQGEDYRGLTEALWTKIRCLLRLNRTEDAFVIFAELEKKASEHIGEIAAKKFAKKLADEIYILKHLPLADEIAEFRKERVSAALIEANGVIGKAAKILQLKNHQALSNILNNQFPELLDELGFKRRVRRYSFKSKKTKTRSENLDSYTTLPDGKISRLILNDKHFSFNFEVLSDRLETFYFDKYLMENFGIESGAIVAVASVSKLKAGMLVLVSDKDDYHIGKIEYEEWARIYFILDEKGSPIPLDKSNIIGEPVGFCLFSEADEKYLQFNRLAS